MYDRRLKAWAITKNLKSDDKQDLINMLVSTGTWVGERLPLKSQQLSVSLKDQAKLVRHLKDRRRRPSTSPETSPGRCCCPGRSPPCSQPCGSSPSPVSDLLGPWTMISLPAEPATPETELSKFITSDYQHLQHHDDAENLAVHYLDPEPPMVDCLNAKHARSSLEGNPKSFSDESDSAADPQPSSTLNLVLLPAPVSSRGDLNVEKMLLSIQAYFIGCTTAFRCTDPFSVPPSSHERLAPSYHFWSELKHGIYLLKVQSPELAWPALNKACELAPSVVNKKTSFDFLFLKELFLTLSPVNTRSYPMVRVKLLQYLSSLAQSKLNANHPLAVICHELQQDGSSREISEVALECMLNSIRSCGDYGSGDDLQKLASHVECAAITLLRRDGQLQLAALRARTLLDRCKRRLAPLSSTGAYVVNDSLSLNQARMAATELVHVRMDQRGEHYDEAIEQSLFALTGLCVNSDAEACPSWPPPPSLFAEEMVIRDKKSIHTLEDLAKVYEELEEHAQAIQWLELSENMACSLLGGVTESVATAHIVEKLNNLRFKVALCQLG